jgi:hypothetical protein
VPRNKIIFIYISAINIIAGFKVRFTEECCTEPQTDMQGTSNYWQE